MVKNKENPKQKSEKSPATKPSHGADGEKPAIWQDERFQHLVTDPRFRSLPQTQRKVKIDKRFQGMFTDDKFKVKYTVDKYGRRVNKSNSEDLKKYYEIETSSGESDEEQKVEKEEDEEAEQRKEEKAITRDDNDSGESTPAEEEPGTNDELESDGEEVPLTLKERLLDPDIDYARGEGRLVTDSSSDDESSEEEDPVLMLDHVWGELDCDAGTTEESTRRLAVCNMDWDRIRAVDLMVLFSSFLPPGGSVVSVRIYPSEFGKERMAEEEVHGPQELVGMDKEMHQKKNNANSDSEDDVVQEQDSDAEEGDDYHMEKLRQYQLNRLRYYYAVVECDSVATADKVYHECDGIEYESSATRVDLRFIPDDTAFDDDEPTDECTELPETNAYKPRQFTTTALQQAKVDLTWDETAVERKELGDKLSSGKLDDVSDRDLRKIVAYSSEEEADDAGTDGDDESEPEVTVPDLLKGNKEEKQAEKPKGKPKKKKEDLISKYKALLAEINDKEQKEKNKKYEMEYTWTVKDSKEEKDDKDLDGKAKEKQQQQLTPIEKVMQKRNEKNRKRKEERKRKKRGLTSDDSEQLNSDSDESVPDGVDMNDPYFAEEFANGDFVDPNAKRKDKLKKSKETEENDEEEEQKAKELQLLLDDDDDQGKQHFSLEKILKSEQETKSKKKRRKQLKKSKSSIADASKEVEDTFQINVKDDRFNAIYSSHLYNIDPTDSHFKKTKGMEQIIHEKLKRRHGDGDDGANKAEEEAPKRPKKQLENSILVKNLKRKIQMKQESGFKSNMQRS